MRDYRKEHTIKKMAKVLKVSRSGYYKWFNSKENKYTKFDKTLEPKIITIFNDSKKTYGSPRVLHKLKELGINTSRRKVSKIMSSLSLIPKAAKRKKITTKADKNNKKLVKNLVSEINIDRPKLAYCSDITYIKTGEGWLYLATILDMFNRKIVGWHSGAEITTDLVLKALWKAIKKQGLNEGAIFHSDRGSQYTSKIFTHFLNKNGFKQSMSSNCFSNALAESFFHTLKVELTDDELYLTRVQAHMSIFEYIEVFYNLKRLHSSLNYKSPIDFDKEYYANLNKELKCI
jgi:putative transposase